ncbi:hypothetical protein SDJN03_27411, partial [Cucurbita argyrosperma subsp. sororia]
MAFKQDFSIEIPDENADKLTLLCRCTGDSLQSTLLPYMGLRCLVLQPEDTRSIQDLLFFPELWHLTPTMAPAVIDIHQKGHA